MISGQKWTNAPGLCADKASTAGTKKSLRFTELSFREGPRTSFAAAGRGPMVSPGPTLPHVRNRSRILILLGQSGWLCRRDTSHLWPCLRAESGLLGQFGSHCQPSRSQLPWLRLLSPFLGTHSSRPKDLLCLPLSILEKVLPPKEGNDSPLVRCDQRKIRVREWIFQPEGLSKAHPWVPWDWWKPPTWNSFLSKWQCEHRSELSGWSAQTWVNETGSGLFFINRWSAPNTR